MEGTPPSRSTSNIDLADWGGRWVERRRSSPRQAEPGPSQANVISAKRLEFIELDLRSLEYVEPYDDNLTCAICYCPFFDPVKLKCNHYFCTTCIHQALSHGNSGCPSCRSTVKEDDIVVVSKLVEKILDELQVKCPLSDIGCKSVVSRAGVHEHLRKFCGWIEVCCPQEGCDLRIQRRQVDKPCQHTAIECADCQSSMMRVDLENHQKTQCHGQPISCIDCRAVMLPSEFSNHVQACVEVAVPCNAAPYGCDVSLRRKDLEVHTAACPLSKLGPFLEIQNRKLQEHEAAIKDLKRKNNLYKASLRNMQDFLGLSPVTDPSSPMVSPLPAPFSSTTDHLLSLHESLREEVGRVASAVCELEAKSDTMFLNQNLRTKEELARTNGVLSNLRMQTQWLVSNQLQNQQRPSNLGGGTMRVSGLGSPNTGSAGPSSESIAGTAGSSRTMEAPVRRLSDGSRQDTKL